jgi:perosamine synthetase
MRYILTSLSPNVEPADVRRTWTTLLSPWRWGDGKVVEHLEKEIAKRFSGHQAVLMNSGRAALAAVLRGFTIGKGDEVIIQGFTCLAVPAAIMWTGAKPVYADITAETYNLDPADVARKITPRTKAIIVQHTFGIPGPLPELQRLAQERNLVLIEDCAHALGATLDEHPLGTLSHAAILSFGRDKTISSVFGGAIISRDLTFMQRVRDEQQKLPYPPARWVAAQLLHPILLSFVVRTYYRNSLGKALLVAGQKLGLLSKAIAPQEREGKPPIFLDWRYSPALARLLEQQWAKLDSFVRRRRTAAVRYSTALPVSIETKKILNTAGWLRFPWRVTDKKKFLRAARKQKMLLGDWYDTPVAPLALDQQAITHYVPGSCPQAERAAQETINLPTYPTLTTQQVEQVIRFVRSYGK